MAETNATILIPDISGYTEFMTTTELSHGSHAINILIDAILQAVGEEYDVSEIEGDAVLFIRKGPAPAKKEILDICLKIFNAFHFQRKFMQLHTICPCGACQGLINLTLKFVVHHGPLAEIKVGRFVKQSGTEMIVAHRLLKNGIQNNEYLLLTEKLLQQVTDPAEMVEMEWASSSDDYPSIGRIDYRFALLNDARKNVPEPPEPPDYYYTDHTSYLELAVAANYRDVYMVLMDIPQRAAWVPGLQKVTQEQPNTFVGSNHLCSFDGYEAVVSPLRMTANEEGILYAESCRIASLELSLVYEFVIKNISEKTCGFACRFMNAGPSPVPQEINTIIFNRLQLMAEKLKEHCEATDFELFEQTVPGSQVQH